MLSFINKVVSKCFLLERILDSAEIFLHQFRNVFKKTFI